MSDLFKYEQIAEHITRMIRQGHYKPGERLPSLRKLSKQFEVSQSTASLVYSTLENQGVIEIRSQSGCYVRQEATFTLEKPKKSRPTVKTQWIDMDDIVMNTAHGSLDETYIPFAMVAPDPAYIPYKELNRILSGICRTSGK